jgi:copper oxidase (laccase) domain-containing protein
MLTSESLSALPGVRHGFFTREGGVSEGLYASLNCGLGSGDDLENVAENRSRAMAELGLTEDRLATVYQVHSNRAALAEAPWPADERPKVDALVTKTAGLAVGVLSRGGGPCRLARRPRRGPRNDPCRHAESRRTGRNDNRRRRAGDRAAIL